MAQERKCLLIVDDTEIDRIILKSILAKEFEITEASSGNVAFDYITMQGEQLDGILLDLAMPHINGFDVLRFMKDKDITDIPVFLVTAEPTRDNVERAMQYNIADFISKPFDRDDVLRRLHSHLGVTPEYDLKNEELMETKAFISDLETLYKNYLSSHGKEDTRYAVMIDLMRILLTSYNRNLREGKLSTEAIELISKAAYFCDIGEMLIPDRRMQIMAGNVNIQEIQQNHTRLGAELIRLNRSKNCKYFVEVCASMCLHHHERYDGKGYPDGIRGKNNSPFNLMCRCVDEFEQMRSKFYGDKSRPVKFIIRRMVNDNVGMLGPKVNSILEDCEAQMMDYFMKKDT